jgi:hypothetical protein
MLENTSMGLNAASLQGFKQGMRERGYIEGQSFIIEYRSVDGRAERYPDLAAELVRLGVGRHCDAGDAGGPGVTSTKRCRQRRAVARPAGPMGRLH